MSAQDPFDLFEGALGRARAANLPEPEAVALATVGPEGPSVRMVLFRGVREGGFSFFTNLGSRKAHELDADPRAALCFFWAPLHEQIRVEGRAKAVSPLEADAYWASRPRGSQLGGWASRQSETLDARSTLLARVEEAERRFAGGPVPRPPFWSGYVLVPERIEFWHGREDRLHERLLYLRAAGGTGWERRMLYP
jgi:pyridoxamine 5'-phosphate oxidase